MAAGTTGVRGADGAQGDAGEGEMMSEEEKCPFCPDGHKRADKGPWSVWVAQDRDSDGQPLHLIVARPDMAHVAEDDAVWLRELINRRERQG